MNSNKTLCLNMIVKNESEIIIDTLTKLLKKINFDYWVISDTGSTDNTIELITNFFNERNIKGEMFEDKWEDFGTNRTKALEHAYNKTDYLLIFDADDEIYGNFKLPNEYEFDAYHFTIGSDSFSYQRRLLVNNRKKWKFVGVLHEAIDCLEPSTCSDLLGDYYVISGRTSSRNKDPNKYYNDAIILEKGFEKEKDSDKGLAARYSFYCGQSYKDAGLKYADESIKWYLKCLDINHWNQEKFYACLMLGDIYQAKGDNHNAITYWLKTIEYDEERIEGVLNAMNLYRNTGNNLLVNLLYERFKNYNKKLTNKLFIYTSSYNDEIEYHNSICAFYTNNKESGYFCSKKILINKITNISNLLMTCRNIMFYKDFLNNDKNTLELFYSINDILYKLNNLTIDTKDIIELWNLLFEKNKSILTIYKKSTPKNKQNPQIFLSITSCKRLNLFKQTINSIMNHWLDIDKVDYWFCVDDNSIKEDRTFMLKNYSWFEYYMKNNEEKGHVKSMNIIWDKLNKLKPKYWIHLEDDFIFHTKMDYIKLGIEGLNTLNDKNVKQILFNLNYAELTEEYKSRGNIKINDNFSIHDHKEGIFPYSNHHYWPNYSFRPSIIDVETVLKLGDFTSPNNFFELDYANKWTSNGFKSGFFNRITCKHIGRLTHQHDIPNAYEMNNTTQFNIIKQYIKIINLEKRQDRKNNTINILKNNNINNYEFIKAIDGRELIPDLRLKKIFEGNDFGNNKGVIGCALSHYNLWQRLIDDNNNEYYIIAEDDFICIPDFKSKFESLKNEFVDKDLIFLGYHMFEKDRKKYKDIYDNYNQEIKIEQLNKDLYIGGTFTYSINKNGAKKLIEYIEKYGIKHGIDYVIKIISGLECYESQPLLTLSEWNENGKEIDSDIQNIYSCLNLNNVIENQFVFIKGLDQIKYDLYYINNNPVENMKKAIQDVNCIGFNSLGFFKTKIENLTTSQYFKESDGIYIKKEYYNKIKNKINMKKIRIKMLCNWCSSKQLCDEWSNMCYDNYVWDDIEITWEDTNIDYYVIINFPHTGDYYIPDKTIIMQMEPYVYDNNKNWGTKTWGEWADPDKDKFLKILNHRNCLNNVQWMIRTPLKQLNNNLINDKMNLVSVICSQKNHDIGHILRNDFIKYIERNNKDIIHVFGKENYHNYEMYKGDLIDDDKANGIFPYKYHFACENNSEVNYATEKIWDAILGESLCFYYGCPNISDYIDPQAFIKLDLNNFEESLKIINDAIKNDLWSERINIIRKEKQKILNDIGFFPNLKKLINY